MIFEIHAEKNAEDKKIFYYDNMTNILKDSEDNVYRFPQEQLDQMMPQEKYTAFDKDHPIKKSNEIYLLKIQLGLSCNYSCDYCSQKFVERPKETSKKDIDAFLEKLDVLQFNEERGLKIEFWGGEPLVYWKTLKPLAEAIKERFSSWETPPRFAMITNGSILSEEIIDWLMMMDFSISISHDGPGQSVRGPDPFDDPEQKERILGLYRMMSRLQKPISFNPMMNVKNKSRKEVYNWFVELTGDEDIQLGEGGVVDAYDEDGVTNSLQTLQEHFEFRRTSFADIYEMGPKMNFVNVLGKIDGMTTSILTMSNADVLGQKCGMDDAHTLAVDLRGNVITCQNVSAAETAMNGQPHLVGNLDDYENVAITTATHWSNRDHCASCPVLHICKGACMYLEGKYWETSCANSYSDNVPLFALSIMTITGYIPTLIKAEGLPLERQDIWGTVYTHEEKPKKKVIPIKVVSEVARVIDGVEVYGKATTV